MEEQYIFLGDCGNNKIYNDNKIFFHLQVDPELDFIDTSGQIYNAMIHNKLINNPNTNILVFNFLPSNNQLEVVVTSHISNKKNITYTSKDLENMFRSAFSNKFNNVNSIPIFIYNGIFISYHNITPEKGKELLNSVGLMPNEGMVINKTHYISTTKAM